ncbi:MAG: hypothetical protein AAB567_03505 [Patescibacteria group bacterium]
MSKPLVIGIIAGVLLVFALAGFLLWQQGQKNSSLRQQHESLKEKTAELASKRVSLQALNHELQAEKDARFVNVESLRAQKEEFEDLISRMTGGTKGDLSNLPQRQRSIRLITPNGGENLCLDEEFEIRWESVNIERVQITLKEGGFGFRIADYYPNTESLCGRLVGRFGGH